MELTENTSCRYVDVWLPLPIFRKFTYSFPINRCSYERFSRVIVEFQRRLYTAFIAGENNSVLRPEKIKPIKSIIDTHTLLTEDLQNLALWMSEYYLVPPGVLLSHFIPFGKELTCPEDELERGDFPPSGVFVTLQKWDEGLNLGNRQRSFLKDLKKKGGSAELSRLPSLSKNSLQSLQEKGIITLRKVPHSPESFFPVMEKRSGEVTLTEEQQAVFQSLINFLHSEKSEVCLLHGATGSGKTEIYLKLAKEVLSQGKRVLVLVPEIALTPQLTARFYAQFPGRVAVWHSNLRPIQRRLLWKYIYYGLVDVVIGARSAIFLPLKEIGLIVVDEEHEGSYKQEEPDPRYNARDVAVYRGKLEKAMVLLGSATPSLESYYNCTIRKYHYLQLKERYGKALPPSIHLINMSDEYEKKGTPDVVFSDLLLEKIKERLQKEEQIILLQNRRGYSPIILCLDCGYVERCPYCQVPMTYHKTSASLHCHYCGHRRSVVATCPECQGTELIYHGYGTQRIEEELRKRFPDIRIIRMDLDTTRKAGSHTELLQSFAHYEYDLLLGTQMIAKGLDFPRVTLVGVINADLGLNLPDFRAREKTFQLLYQVAGRSGRGEKKGEVVIQTINPRDICIQMAVQQDLKRFYNLELADRANLGYPPFSRMIKLKFSGEDRKTVELTAKKAFNFLAIIRKQARLIGPAPAPLEKLRGKYRFHLILKQNKKTDPAGNGIRNMVKEFITSDYYRKLPHSVTIKVDVDPYSML